MRQFFNFFYFHSERNVSFFCFQYNSGSFAPWFDVLSMRDSVAMELRVELGMWCSRMWNGSWTTGAIHGMRRCSHRVTRSRLKNNKDKNKNKLNPGRRVQSMVQNSYLIYALLILVLVIIFNEKYSIATVCTLYNDYNRTYLAEHKKTLSSIHQEKTGPQYW